MNTPAREKAKAVIAHAHGAPVVVEDIWVDPPRQGEVMVKMEACGVCHSDLSTAKASSRCRRPVAVKEVVA